MYKKMMMLGLAVAVLCFAGVIKPGKAFACSCAMPGSAGEQVKGELERKTAIFAGKVLKVTPPEKKEIMSSADLVEVEFEVSKVWKGEPGEKTLVYTALSSASCGIENFQEGAEYLVSAYENQDVLETNICDMTKQLDSAGEELKVLGEGKAPEPIPLSASKEKEEKKSPLPMSADEGPSLANDEDSPSSGAGIYATIAAIVLLLGAAILLVRMKRNK